MLPMFVDVVSTITGRAVTDTFCVIWPRGSCISNVRATPAITLMLDCSVVLNPEALTVKVYEPISSCGKATSPLYWSPSSSRYLSPHHEQPPEPLESHPRSDPRLFP